MNEDDDPATPCVNCGHPLGFHEARGCLAWVQGYHEWEEVPCGCVDPEDRR
jgi:hypothetical protein